MKRRISLLSIMIALALFIGGLNPLSSLAAGDAKVMQAIANENTVKAFVRGVTSSDGATYQIANVPSEEPKGYKISEDTTNMRTLIMVDNSLSIPNNSRPLVKEAMKAIIDAHAENETFRLATFSDSIGYLSDQYSSDYTALKNVVDSIENEVALQRPNVYDAEIYVRPGDEVREVKSSLDRSGHVIVTADTVLEAINNAEELIKEIKINTL